MGDRKYSGIVTAGMKERIHSYILFKLRCDVPIENIEKDLMSMVCDSVTEVNKHLDDTASQIAKSLEEGVILWKQ